MSGTNENTLEPDTLANIQKQSYWVKADYGNTVLFEYQCGCFRIDATKKFWLCQWHAGFNAGVEVGRRKWADDGR